MEHRAADNVQDISGSPEGRPAAPARAGADAPGRVRFDGRHASIAVSWIAVAAWAVFVFCMSANTGGGLEHGDGIVSQVYQWLKGMQARAIGGGMDVVNPIAHFCEYAVFGALLANAWRLSLPSARQGAAARLCRGPRDAEAGREGSAHGAVQGRVVLLAVLCASLYGVTDELHQYFVPGRACDPADWLVDTCGAAFGALALWALARRSRERR